MHSSILFIFNGKNDKENLAALTLYMLFYGNHDEGNSDVFNKYTKALQ
jgi:hypothetical protein